MRGEGGDWAPQEHDLTPPPNHCNAFQRWTGVPTVDVTGSDGARGFNNEANVNELATVEHVNDGAQLMSIIERAATDPAFDVEKMRAMLDMKVQWDAMQAEQAYNDAMRACQDEMRAVVRDRQNDHTKAKYATLENIHGVAKPTWLRHGFSLSSHSDVSPIPGHYRVVTTCRHTGGHKTTHFLDAPPDDVGTGGKTNKTPIQALGSTVSYVRRYLDLMIFDITLVGEDRDGNGPVKLITEEQAVKIREWVDELGINPKRILDWAQIEALADMTADRYPAAIEFLKGFEKRK